MSTLQFKIAMVQGEPLGTSSGSPLAKCAREDVQDLWLVDDWYDCIQYPSLFCPLNITYDHYFRNRAAFSNQPSHITREKNDDVRPYQCATDDWWFTTQAMPIDSILASNIKQLRVSIDIHDIKDSYQQPLHDSSSLPLLAAVPEIDRPDRWARRSPGRWEVVPVGSTRSLASPGAAPATAPTTVAMAPSIVAACGNMALVSERMPPRIRRTNSLYHEIAQN